MSMYLAQLIADAGLPADISREDALSLQEEKDYSDGMTKQSYADSTDINKILKKAQREGSISHLQKYDKAVYGEFTGVDLLGAYEQAGRAQAIFDDLPSEIRREFNNDAFKFAGFASDPANIDKLDKIFPALAEPGRQNPNPVKREPDAADAASAPSSSSSSSTPADGTPSADSAADGAASSST